MAARRRRSPGRSRDASAWRRRSRPGRALRPTAEEYGADIPLDLARITKAVTARDGEKARDLMRTHVERFNKLNKALRNT